VALEKFKFSPDILVLVTSKLDTECNQTTSALPPNLNAVSQVIVPDFAFLKKPRGKLSKYNREVYNDRSHSSLDQIQAKST